MKFPLHSYVKVIEIPQPWESSGESFEDMAAYVGHVGLVVECPTSDDLPLYLVRFPSHQGEKTGQRNIEAEALELVSIPSAPLCDTCLEN